MQVHPPSTAEAVAAASTNPLSAKRKDSPMLAPLQPAAAGCTHGWIDTVTPIRLGQLTPVGVGGST